jgi:hypothetical protein
MDSRPARRAPLLGVLVAAAAVLTLLLGAPQAHAAACTTSWTAGNGNWNDPSNWDSGVPDASDVACIQGTGDKQIVIQAQTGNETNATATAKELHLGGTAGTQIILISSETLGVVPVDYDASLTLVGGAGSASDVNDHGQMQIQKGGISSGGSNASICAVSPLTNGGTIQTLGSLGDPRVLGGDITNQGTLSIDIDTSVPSSGCGPGISTLRNNGGTVTVSPSRKLTVAGAYEQTSGSTTGPFVVDAGRLGASGGTGTFSVQRDSLLSSDVGADVTLEVEGTAAQHASVGTLGATTNNGTIDLTSLDSSPSHHGVLFEPSSGTFTNKGEIDVVPGEGGIRDFGGTIDNQGTLLIGDVHAADEFGSALHLTNSGDIAVSSGGSFAPVDLTQNGGTVTVDGTLDYGSGTLAVDGGTVKGTGTINAATLANDAGTVHPGDSPGLLTVDGSFSQGAGGTLALEVAGPIAGTDHSQLAVTGNAALGGTLKVTTTGAQHDTYKILQAQQVTGAFAATSFTGQSYGVQTNSNNVTLVAPPFNTTKPSIAGKPRVGNTLTCNKGIWVPQGSPLTYQYRWLRDGKLLAATSAKRKVLAADQAHRLSCRVIATNLGGSTSATSNPTAKVPSEPLDRGKFPKHTVRATTAGNVNVPVRNPNPVAVAVDLTLRNAKGKVVGHAKFQIAKTSTKPVKVHLKSGAFAKLLAKGQRAYGATLVLSKGKVKRTTKTQLTVKKPKP